ncbi:MAG: ComEC/Rec2 family competence protein [Cyanobacteria bacterium P01_D01_bin.105]
MTPWGALVICWAYLTGLLITGLNDVVIMSEVSVAGLLVLLGGGIAGAFVPRYWRMGPTRQQWWIAGVIGLMGASYCLIRAPEPVANDVSFFASEKVQHVVGRVVAMPQKTRYGKGRFFFEARSVREEGGAAVPKRVGGKLYVTAPLWPSEQMFPGQSVELQGKIQEIETAKETDKSSFGDYLAKQGCFAKFRTHWVEFLPGQEPPRFALWKLRQRIVTAQGRWLPEPMGNLLSAMTLGRRAVDLPHDVRDSFVDAGLAHTLAASGFHVSLILGLVLSRLKGQSPKTQAITGTLTLLIYVGLTGLQPSVVRASVMGLGALIGLSLGRKVKPVGCLLVAVTLILLVNPQWIWDVGFQLSAMATLGLIVTVPWLVKRLEFIPTTIASALAVPVAAFAWTIPLQLYRFETVSPYAIPLNGIGTPLVILTSVGGFVSAGAAMIWPVLGSAIAAPFRYPIQLLMWLVDKFNHLPGSSIAVEGIGVRTVVIMYGVFAAVSIWIWRSQRESAFDTEDF